MSQRRNRPVQPGSSGSQRTLLFSIAALVIVVAIVVALIFATGSGGKNASTPTAPVPSPTAAAAQGTSPVTPQSTHTATAEASASASVNATKTPAPTPVPTPTVVVGEFGPLPPAEMASGNSASRPLDLEYRLDMSLQLVPKDAEVYQLLPRTWTADQVKSLAQSLGVNGDVVDQGGGSFRASGNGSLYVSGNLVQYAALQTATPVAGPLPTDDILTQVASQWLLKNQIVGAEAGPGTVVDRNKDTGQALVLVKPVEPKGLLSAVPSAAVTVAANGTVVQATVQWPAGFKRSTYGLRGASDLWNEAQTGRAYVEVDPQQLPPGNDPVNGTVTITSADLAYTTAGNAATQPFLVPLVVFAGQAQIQGVASPVPVKIYVQAVAAQTAPRG